MRVFNYRYEIGKTIGNVVITKQLRNTTNNQKTYEYRCQVCGNQDNALESVVMRAEQNKGVVCSVCSNTKVVEGINDIPTTAPWMVPYFQGGYDEAKAYSHSSHQKKYFRCPNCNRVKTKSIQIKTLYEAHYLSCVCRDGLSYPNKFMFNVLEQLGCEFIAEYSPKWVQPFRYDFYIPSLQKIIEMDGGLGHGNVSNFYGDEEKTKLRDIEKDTKAFKHGITVVRIDSTKSDRQYLQEQIKNSEIFSEQQIQKIDFTKSDEFALSNRAKEVCNYYEIHKPISTTRLSEIFKIHQSVIWKYLSKGNKFGWCTYDGKSIMQENGENRCKPIVIIKDGNEIKHYKSARELVQNSLKDFNETFSFSRVCAVARDGSTQYKGYNFRYLEKKEVNIHD